MPSAPVKNSWKPPSPPSGPISVKPTNTFGAGWPVSEDTTFTSGGPLRPAKSSTSALNRSAGVHIDLGVGEVVSQAGTLQRRATNAKVPTLKLRFAIGLRECGDSGHFSRITVRITTRPPLARDRKQPSYRPLTFIHWFVRPSGTERRLHQRPSPATGFTGIVPSAPAPPQFDSACQHRASEPRMNQRQSREKWISYQASARQSRVLGSPGKLSTYQASVRQLRVISGRDCTDAVWNHQ
jgi:hypothetical protein